MRRPRELAVAVARISGVARARRHDRTLDSLEEAMAENARLAELLTDQVRQLEQRLVPLLEADRARAAAEDPR